MSLAHYIRVSGTGESCTFEKGYHLICGIIQQEQYRYLFQCAKESTDFDSFMKLSIILFFIVWGNHSLHITIIYRILYILVFRIITSDLSISLILAHFLIFNIVFSKFKGILQNTIHPQHSCVPLNSVFSIIISYCS